MNLKDLELTKEEQKQLVALKSLFMDVNCFGHNMALDETDALLLKEYKKTELLGATMLGWFDKLHKNPIGDLLLLSLKEVMDNQKYLIKCEDAKREFSVVEDDLTDTITEFKEEIQEIVEQLGRICTDFGKQLT